MPVTILATADLHLGRASTQAPAGVPAEALRSRNVWDSLVMLAKARRVDALLVAGDLIDASNRRWEAMGPITRGVATLAQAGIRTIAVAGNHDWEALPRLAALLEGEGVGSGAFTLLGSGGRWQSELLVAGGERVRIEGWSFPAERVREDPLTLRHASPSAEGASIGLLHGDLDNPDSRYAPLRRRALEDARLDAWILGHVHRPALHEVGRGVALYAGSPQALDFGEQGPHGAWLLEVVQGEVQRPTFVPLSTVRYESLAVDLTLAEGLEDADALCLARLRELESVCRRESAPALLGLAIRLRLVGRSAAKPFARELCTQLSKWLGSGELAISVHEVEDLLLPAVDLEAVAQGAETSPMTLLARLLLRERLPQAGSMSPAGTLDSPPPPPPLPRLRELLSEIERAVASVDQRAEYSLLDADDDAVGAETEVGFEEFATAVPPGDGRGAEEAPGPATKISSSGPSGASSRTTGFGATGGVGWAGADSARSARAASEAARRWALREILSALMRQEAG